MGNFTYIMNADNQVVLKAGLVSATATDSADTTTLGPANAIALPVSLPWRSNGVGSKSLIIDFGSSVSVDFVAVVGHNISSSATELRAFGDSSTPPAAIDVINMLPNHLGRGTTWGLAASSASNRYWSIEITDNSNPDGYYEIGYVIFGVASELGFNMNYDWNEQLVYDNRKAKAYGGSPLVGEVVEHRSKIDLTFGNLLKTERNTFKQFVDGFDGARKPAFFVPDPDDNLGFFGRLTTPTSINFTHRNKGVMDGAKLSFEEDTRGIRVAV